jgi:excisionase family DNA binding protein
MNNDPVQTDQPRELLRVEEAAARLAISRTYMFGLLRDQVIESVKVGRLRRVPADAITAYINRLAAEQRPDTA